MKIEGTDDTLMFMSIICVYQFLKIKMSRLKKNFFFAINSCIGLQKGSDWVDLAVNAGHFSCGVSGGF